MIKSVHGYVHPGMVDDEVKRYEFQLQQVQEQLKSKPDCKILQELQKKLSRLLALSQNRHEGMSMDEKDSSDILLRHGDKCQVKVRSTWEDAIIQSVAIKKKSCTVILLQDGQTKHCLAKDVRVAPEKRTRPPLESHTRQTRPKLEPTKGIKTEHIGKGEGHRERGGGKAEYIKKKEEEHQERQESWQKFSKKMGIGKR